MKYNRLTLAIALAACMLLLGSCDGERRHAQTADGEHEMLCGGYTEFRALTESELDLFDRVVSQAEGAKYDAEEVATQVVNGTNYRFLARSTDEELVMITIYVPLPGNGEPQITSIEKME